MGQSRYPYIDMHCDTLLHGVGRDAEEIYELGGTMLDVRRLRAAGAGAQFFAIFFPPKHAPGERPPAPEHRPDRPLGPPPGAFRPPVVEDDLEFYAKALGIFRRTLFHHPEEIAFAGNAEDLSRNLAGGRLSAFLTLEDGRAVEGKLERLQSFYDDGVRLITLTWNFPNCFGNPNSRDVDKMRLGLTQFGLLAVEEMNRLGMLVDVSHLSDGGFWDVARVSSKPFVASHSNCRALTDHPRNLTDEMIRTLAEHGGAAGLNFAPEFVEAERGTGVSSLERLCAHAEHLLRVGGEDLPAIGTDFDGVHGKLEIGEPERMERLFEELKRRGFTERQIEKFAFGNIVRVIREAL